MKRCVISTLLMAVALPASFASGLEIGPTAMLRFPLALDDSLSSFEGLGVEDFKFGADVEFSLGPVQLGALLGFRPGRSEGSMEMPPAIEALLTGGLLLDLAFVRLGASIGPTLIFDLRRQQSGGPPPPPGDADGPGDVGFGLGIKANADLVLGSVALRLNAISGFDVLRMAVAENALAYVDVKLGLSLLFAL